MSATARAAKRLRASARLALTGTPIENRLSEIWSIFDFVSPGLLGSLERFEEKLRAADRARRQRRGASGCARRIHPLRPAPHQAGRGQGPAAEDRAGASLVPMADEQQQALPADPRQVRESVMSEVEKQGIAKSSIQILAALMRLRQVACDPRLLKLTGDFARRDAASSTRCARSCSERRRRGPPRARSSASSSRC